MKFLIGALLFFTSIIPAQNIDSLYKELNDLKSLVKELKAEIEANKENTSKEMEDLKFGVDQQLLWAVKSDGEFNNPDGERISFHFTPYKTTGDVTTKFTSLNSSYRVYPSQETISYKDKYSYLIEMRIPAKHMTFAPFFHKETWILETQDNNIKINKEDRRNKYGIRISLYF